MTPTVPTSMKSVSRGLPYTILRYRTNETGIHKPNFPAGSTPLRTVKGVSHSLDMAARHMALMLLVLCSEEYTAKWNTRESWERSAARMVKERDSETLTQAEPTRELFQSYTSQLLLSFSIIKKSTLSPYHSDICCIKPL